MILKKNIKNKSERNHQNNNTDEPGGLFEHNGPALDSSSSFFLKLLSAIIKGVFFVCKAFNIIKRIFDL